MSLREQLSHALRESVGAHLTAMGPCDDLDHQDDDYCRAADCTYCAMAMATQALERVLDALPDIHGEPCERRACFHCSGARTLHYIDTGSCSQCVSRVLVTTDKPGGA